MEWFFSLVNKNFVLHRYSSLTVQEVETSREHMKIGRTGGFLLSPRSLNGVALVQLSQHRWHLVYKLEMKMIYSGSDENFTATWLIYFNFTHERFCFHHGQNTKLHTSSSIAMAMVSSYNLGY